MTVKYRHALADDKTYLYFTDYWFLLRYTVIIYKFTQGNLGAKKITRSRFQSPVKKKIANYDIGDRQRDPWIDKVIQWYMLDTRKTISRTQSQSVCMKWGICQRDNHMHIYSKNNFSFIFEENQLLKMCNFTSWIRGQNLLRTAQKPPPAI